MTNITFPKTNVVGCVFSLQTSNRVPGTESAYDDYGRTKHISRLKVYHYRVPKYLEGVLRVGDIVVTKCQTGFQLCEVVEVNALPGCDRTVRDLAPVVCVCDFAPFMQDQERMAQLKYMREEIEHEKKRLESMVTYDLIAEKNPDFKAMLDAFMAAGGEI